MVVRKYHYSFCAFFIICFVFLFGFSTSQAYMTSEYLDYAIDTLYNNAVYDTYNLRDILNVLNNDSIAKNTLLTRINNQFDTWGIPNIDDTNIFGLCYDRTASTLVIKIFVCNMSVPGEYTNLDFYLLKKNYIYPYSHNTTDCFYEFNIEYQLTYNNTLNLFNFSTYIVNGSQSSYVFLGTVSFSQISDTILNSSNIFCAGIPSGFAYYPLDTTSSIIPVILQDYNGNYQPPTPEPEPTPTPTSLPDGTITNNSGETTGSINLSGIEQGITDIQNTISGESQKIIDNQIQNTNTIVNTISGETQKITNTLTESADDTIDNTIISSGDITDALDFEFEPDPYANFWFEMINGLNSALLGTVRTYNISFRGQTFTINLDDFTLQLPEQLKFILSMVSTIIFVWILVKWTKIILNKISSGNMDEVLAMNEEERYY